MRIEHVAFNVAQPQQMASWYRQHLGFSLKRALNDVAQTHFLADDSGVMMIEIYCNPADQVPDYAAMDPLILHLALVSADPVADSARLIAAGASHVTDVYLNDGSHLAMLRDPWGLALQLCRRGAGS
ncbi:catechol 2,3-dioxygenase-like lactoylglutathione lyase family enzyme [Rheinheimera pacifica]|uniref:VOC family protein n=1 Tax=Rheinheimera pacifica TaxID=173990 RepID=UPI00285D2699|nr:VOC family protein [Rheinheimera pacifica]MDR6983312.1 catechol 2,3-dioxygenase-like lactoylglutathione lyase family enzyme [Rheinheimera pacifica]